jgi:HEAT repeat protein
VGPLLAALGSGREAEAVVAALGEIGDREAVPALIEALGSAALVDAAAQALGKMGDPRAVEPLAAALRGDAGSPGIITRALIGFGEAAVPAVIPALADPRTAVREKAADLLDALNWQPAADAAGAAYCVARQDWDKCVEIGPVAVEPLLAALSATDDEVRHGAARALVAIGSPAVQPLIAALAEAKPPALSAIVEALGSIGDPRAVRPLLELSARGHDDQTRRAVDSAIAAIGPDAAAGPLASALADEAREVREAAIDGLVAIGEAGRTSLRGALGSSFPDVRSAAAEALAGSGEPDALELLAPLFEDSEWPVRCAAARAAARLSDPNAAPLLVAALDDENSSVQVAAGRAIVALSGCLPMEPLVAAVKCSDVEVRKSAADALSRMGWAPDKSASGAAYWIARRDWDSCMNIGAPAVGPLIDALKDPEKGIPEAAAHALGAIGDRRAAQPLIEAAMKNRGSSNKSRWMPMYAAAGRALARLNDPQALEGLLAALRDDSHDTRVAAAELLVAMYRSPDLDAAARNAILSERGRITQPWESVPANAGAPHEDNLGIGIDF